MKMQNTRGRVWGAETIEAKAAREAREAKGGNGQQEGGPFGCETKRVGSPNTTWMSDVVSRPVEWLWPGRFAIGKLSMIVGLPDLGKSTVTTDMAARVSAGMAWPDNTSAPQELGGVVILSAEDSAEDTIKPRLEAASADVGRILLLDSVNKRGRNTTDVQPEAFCITSDLPALEAAIDEVVERVGSCRMAIIDPVMAFMGNTDTHRDADTRRTLAPLAAMAARRQIAVVCVAHLNKNVGAQAMLRVGGSMAIVAAARAVWCVTGCKDDKDRRLILSIKNNLARNPGGLAYSIRNADNGLGSVAWETGPVDVTADDALAPPAAEEERTDRDDAADWLRDVLADGPLGSKEVFSQARQNGIAKRTLRRAYRDLGGKAKKSGMGGGWSMGLSPEGGHEIPKAATSHVWPSSGSRGRLRMESDGCAPAPAVQPKLPGPTLPADLQPFGRPEDTGSLCHREHLARIRRTAATPEDS